jgi:Na+/H+ antiporter NhaD/arsenite permease-like protein
MQIETLVKKYLLLLLVASGVGAVQNVPLGEAIRNRNVQIYKDLKLDALPSPAAQGAADKKFFEGHWHGLELIRLSRELRQEYDIPADIQGLLIDEVTLEATECGFLAGDVVQSVAGYPTLTLKDFLKASMKVQNETKVKIVLYRSSHAQALSGDIAINDLKTRANILNAPQQAKTMTLVLRIADYYNNLGYANMDAAPPIQPGAISPHKDRGRMCTECHVFMNTGGQLAVDAGDLVPNPPAINEWSPCPHEARGQCNFCHQIIKSQNPRSTTLGDALRRRPRATAAAFVDTVVAAKVDSAVTYSVMPAVPSNTQPYDSAVFPAFSPTTATGRIDTVMPPMMQPDGKLALGTILEKEDQHRKGFRDDDFSTRTVGILIILAFIYFLIFNNILGRMISFPIGAILVLVLGYKFEFYNIMQALGAINFNLLMFIIGMNFIIAVLQESGFFENIAGRLAIKSNGNKLGLFVLFCLLAYVLAAFLDNIAVILVLVPLTLRLAKGLRFDPKPFIIGVIISSNLGGASTMIGDIPNLLITLSTKLRFMDFIIYEAPCCILMLGAMFVFMWMSNKNFFTSAIDKVGKDEELVELDNFSWVKPVTNPKAVTQALTVLAIVTVGIIFAAQLAGIITLVGGLIVLLIGAIPRRNIIKHAGWGDIAFFTSLFIIVGAFEASGVLYYIAHDVLLQWTDGNILAVAVLILTISALITAFMNAGPTTAMFIPMIIHLGIQAPNNLLWWALSLGVVCGSSASLYGATGGPLASSLISKYWQKNRKQLEEDPLSGVYSKTLDMREYIITGVPIGAIFLALSIGYIMTLYFVFQVR